MAIYEMAGLRVDMSPQHVLTAQRAAAYRVDGKHVDITLHGEGDPWEEHAAFAQSFYEQLLGFDGFLLHASAVQLNGKAYLFSASSGTGKSTHASFWRTALGATVINDDKPAIRCINGVFHACGTPFSGKHDLSAPVCVPLGGIALLQRGDQNAAYPADITEALWFILNQTLRPQSAEQYNVLLSLIERLLAAVPVYVVSCTNDPSAAHACKAAFTAK